MLTRNERMRSRFYLGLAKFLYALPDLLAWVSIYLALFTSRLNVAIYVLLFSIYSSHSKRKYLAKEENGTSNVCQG